MLRAVIVTATVAALAAAPAAPAKSVGPGFFGVSGPFVFDESDPAARELHLDAVARLGAGTVRIALSWAEVEPHPPGPGGRTYHWANPDRRVEMLARHGLRMYPVLIYTPPWAREPGATEKGAPRRDAVDDFAGFAAAAAARYGPDGSFWRARPDLPYLPARTWEVWNEPNLEQFWGGKEPDPRQYARLLSITAAALAAAAPAAKPVLGGLSAAEHPRGYLRRVFDEVPALRRRIDRVGFHPYGADAAAGKRRLRRFRRAVDEHGRPGMWIEITEDGMATRRDPKRRRYLARMAASVPSSGCRVSRYIVHTWVTEEGYPDDPEHWYGIANSDATPKGSGRAYRRAIRAASSPAATGAPPGARIC